MDKRPFLVIFMLIAFSALGAAQETAAERRITVTGEALIMVVPDEAVVTIGVETFDASLQKGLELNNAAARRCLDSIKALGLDERQIQTEELSVYLLYKSHEHPSMGIEGYILRRLYVVTLKDAKRAATVVNTGLLNGANVVMGINYRSTALRKHRDAARAAAMRAAKAKAAALLGEVGCNIGPPQSACEMNFDYYGYNRGQMTQNVMMSVEGSAVTGDVDMNAVPEGQIGIRATVQVVFDIVTG